MQELVSRTMMLVAFFEPDSASACQCAEHRAIFRSLAKRERGKAIRSMTTHLSLVETRLRPRACEEVGDPLEQIFADCAPRGRIGAPAAELSREMV